MNLPAKITVYQSAYWLDGGTTDLKLRDENGENHELTLTEHSDLPDEPEELFGRLPGRLFYDEMLIPIRSPQEMELLQLLKSADISYESETDLTDKRIELSPKMLVFGDDIKQLLNQAPEENLRSRLNDIISFVESDEYISYAAKADQIYGTDEE